GRRSPPAAARPRPPTGPSPRLHKLLPPLLALMIPVAVLGIYLQLGHPGLPSAPFRPGAVQPREPAIDIPGLVAAARARAAAQPDDPDAQAALGEALTLEADGTVTVPAAAAFKKAFQRRPDDPR